MAITVTRLMVPGKTSFQATATEYRATEIYLIEGDPGDDAEDPSTAKDAAGLPAYLSVHPLISGIYVVQREVENHGPNSCLATITYSDNWRNTLTTDGASQLSVDMMGQTAKRYVGIDGTTAIGQVDPNSAQPEGVDVYIPHLRLTYEQKQSTLDSNIYSLTGYVNNATYKGFAARTLLFLGATARKEQGGSWRVTYQFLYDPGEHKAYWQVFTGEISGGDFVGTPSTVYNTEIYNEADFSVLPI
jgi:hypothetical protein